MVKITLNMITYMITSRLQIDVHTMVCSHELIVFSHFLQLPPNSLFTKCSWRGPTKGTLHHVTIRLATIWGPHTRLVKPTDPLVSPHQRTLWKGFDINVWTSLISLTVSSHKPQKIKIVPYRCHRNIHYRLCCFATLMPKCCVPCIARFEDNILLYV